MREYLYHSHGLRSWICSPGTAGKAAISGAYCAASLCRSPYATYASQFSFFLTRQEGNGKIPGLAGVEESAKASRDGRPSKVSLVGGSATCGKLGAVRRIGEQSHERVVEFVGLI